MNIPEIFKFNDDVSENFDIHVNEQLPWYGLVTDFVCHLACHYLKDNGRLLDVGASTGNITRQLSSVITARNITAFSVDNSESMRANFNGVGSLDICNIEDFNLEKYDVIVCCLSLMFVDVSKREQVISNLIMALNKKGCLIIVDKFNPSGGYIGNAISKMTMKAKLKNGATAEDILKKELSLIGVQRPMDIEMMQNQDFFEFFRFGDFSGLIYEGK